MYGFINGYDFGEMEAQKYYSPSAAWSEEKKRENARMKIFSGDWLGAEKKDGYFSKLIKDEDGTIILYGRSRNVEKKYVDKHEWVPHLQPLFDAIPTGTCLLGELYFPNAPGSKNVTTIMGCLKDKAVARQEKGEKLHFYIFDCLAWGGDSLMDKTARTRFDCVMAEGRALASEYVSAAEYKSGRDLWMMMQQVLARGDEGVVITRKDACYEPGKRPGKTTLKVKKEIKQNIDCFFTGMGSPPAKEYTGKEIENWTFWENIRTGEKMVGRYFNDYQLGGPIIPITKGYFHGWCGSMEIAVFRKNEGSKCKINGVEYNDVIIQPIGWLGGITEEMKANPKKYAYIPIEVTAMEYDIISHSLRHGKMVGWRKDLPLGECTFEKIEPEDY